ncbi:NPC intracellular cholesterol transporter 1 [Camellia lanceoleosa]|uniref:NPC intracellular cholesterol transporter 1 n=1 Tax=Camellia lanceoleosa TaxID=1840588 RepID=A0ACC0GU97_9ERIC|nr:NPC intracellular cholesterol transporter 1 [Camellia lanceoleosa]
MPESTHIAKPAASWLDDFLVWMSPEAFGCYRKFVDGSYCPLMTSSVQGEATMVPQCLSDLCKGWPWAYTSSVELNGYESGVIRASEFRTYHTPLRKQDDFVNSMHAAREFSSGVSDSLKIEIFPYSVFYIFFEQYLDIWETAVINIAIALGAVFLVCLVITSSLWSSTIIVLVLAMIVVDLLGVMAILDIQLNVVSVVVLSMFGPPSRSVPIEREQELETSTLSHLTD